MPDSGFIDELDHFLSPYDTKRVTSNQLKKYKRDYIAGWELPTVHVFQGQQLFLRMLFRTESRYTRPDIVVHPDVLGLLEFPHTEDGSRLCVWDSFACCDHEGLDYLITLLEDSYTLVGKLLSGKCTDDFKSGFLSYWAYKKSSDVRGVSLCDTSNLGTRTVYLYKSKHFGLIFGETEEQVSSWLINYYNYPPDSKKQSRAQQRLLSRIYPTALFCFDEAWTPIEYPNSIEDLRKLVVPGTCTDEEFAELIGNSLNNRVHSKLGILLMFQTINGPCFAGLSMPKGIFSNKSKFSGSTVLDGFREHIPHNHLIHRAGPIQTLGLLISRADDNWIHGRDKNPLLSELKSHKVMIIGCGSVGSSIATLLVKSGISKIVLIDDETLGFENLSRHELGSNYVGEYKAHSLRKELQIKFPHTEIKAFEKTWQDALHDTNNNDFITQIEEADIILSATADWSSDIGLIELQEQLNLGPIVFSFTEAHALASHIIIHPLGSDAFHNTHEMKGDNVGSLTIPCCAWKSETRVKLPICGGAFQPYGAITLSHLHTMSAEVIIGLISGELDEKPFRKIWLGNTQHLQTEGGIWNPDWINIYGDPDKNGHLIELELSGTKWKLINA
ncbi:MAG: ThiF family adenylyltransferase [Pseudomonadota bacterium]